MLFDIPVLIVLFLLTWFWAPQKPIQIIAWVLLAIALLALVLPLAGVRLHPLYP